MLAAMDLLPLFFRLAGVRVVVVGDGEAAAAKARLVMAAGGVVVADLPARLAFVAIDDADAAAAEAGRLRAGGCLVNVVDRPALCDFTVPAIVDRSPVIVAVGTGGASATLAKSLRERLEALLPGNLGALATAILAARSVVRRVAPTVDARRRLWDAALAPGGALDPLTRHDEPATAVAAALAERPPGAGDIVTTIALASSDPDDLTLRQLRLLNQADTLFHAPGLPAAILDRARRDAICVTGVLPPVPPPGRTVVVLAPGTGDN